jgi:hypothetical protein
LTSGLGHAKHILWKRPIPLWEGHLRDFRSGPSGTQRRLVAVSDRVYATLGYGEPVTALDAATGETIDTYTGTQGTEEIRLIRKLLTSGSWRFS